MKTAVLPSFVLEGVVQVRREAPSSVLTCEVVDCSQAYAGRGRARFWCCPMGATVNGGMKKAGGYIMLGLDYKTLLSIAAWMNKPKCLKRTVADGDDDDVSTGSSRLASSDLNRRDRLVIISAKGAVAIGCIPLALDIDIYWLVIHNRSFSHLVATHSSVPSWRTRSACRRLKLLDCEASFVIVNCRNSTSSVLQEREAYP